MRWWIRRKWKRENDFWFRSRVRKVRKKVLTRKEWRGVEVSCYIGSQKQITFVFEEVWRTRVSARKQEFRGTVVWSVGAWRDPNATWSTFFGNSDCFNDLWMQKLPPTPLPTRSSSSYLTRISALWWRELLLVCKLLSFGCLHNLCRLFLMRRRLWVALSSER